MNHQTLLTLSLAALFATACGGSSPDAALTGPPAGQTVTVTTAPADTTIPPDASVRFSAQVTGTADGSVTWAVVESNGGTVDASGLYTAPSSEGTFHVRAVSTVSGTAGWSIVQVKTGAVAPVVVTVDPATVTLRVGGSQTFAAAVTGTPTRTVTWTVLPGSNCGSISAAGVYTAPPVGATCSVVATSAADATKSASATVTVTPLPVHVVSVTPASASVLTGGTRTFSAAVAGTIAGESTGVTWSVPAGSGSIGASSGVYVAPATPGTYVVTATSVATPVGTATATVTVTAPVPVVAISISPTTATLDACGTRTFTATVTNTSNTAVTWSVTEAGGGTVATGTYTAPQTAGTYHVVATSVADGTKTAVGTITVGTEKVLSVAVNPGSGTVQANGSLAFSALVTTSCGTFAAQ